MRKSKKNLVKRSKKNKTYKKCVYTDETRRIMRIIKDLKKSSKKSLKNVKN